MTTDTITNLTNYLVQTYHSKNPFELSDELGIFIFSEDLGNLTGYFNQAFDMQMIHLNKNLPHSDSEFICAVSLYYCLTHTTRTIILAPTLPIPTPYTQTNPSILFAQLLLNSTTPLL
ncbi:hypothetical protein OL233_08080 [Vagococcus sp. PNs007]|uniref:Uncharacterized protein n=1 Tax=Vagococcus proximus TaxID=2991417 RepID=A0ABT5X2K9_9ENTE|nr:hypothetical protein [Vagococcus proximus]MDF0480239.1 hypothetical protein [Vagococcus proximus]